MKKARKNLALAAAALMLAAPVSAGLGSAVGAAIDAFRPSFMRYEEFKMDKFLPFGCTPHVQNADINGDSIPEHITLCRMKKQGHDSDRLVIAGSEKDGYRRIEFPANLEKNYGTTRVVKRQKEEFIYYTEGKPKLSSLAFEQYQEQTAHILKWDGSYQTDDMPLADYISGLLDEGNFNAVEEFWNGEYNEKQHAAEAISRKRPVGMISFLLEKHKDDILATQVLGRFHGQISARQLAQLYRPGARDVLKAMKDLAMPGDERFLADFYARVIEDWNDHYRAKRTAPSIFDEHYKNMGFNPDFDELQKEHRSCEHKRKAVDLLGDMEGLYARSVRQALVGRAQQGGLPECIKDYAIKNLQR